MRQAEKQNFKITTGVRTFGLPRQYEAVLDLGYNRTEAYKAVQKP